MPVAAALAATAFARLPVEVAGGWGWLRGGGRTKADGAPPPGARAGNFGRIPGIPLYVFARVDAWKREWGRAGREVIDLGSETPNLPPPPIAVEKLCEAAQ